MFFELNFISYTISYIIKVFYYESITKAEIISDIKLLLLFILLTFNVLLLYLWESKNDNLLKSKSNLLYIICYKITLISCFLYFQYTLLKCSDLLALTIKDNINIIFHYLPAFFSIILSTTIYLSFVSSDSDLKNESYKFMIFFALFLVITYSFFYIIFSYTIFHNLLINLDYVLPFYFICIKCKNFSLLKTTCFYIFILCIMMLKIASSVRYIHANCIFFI